MKKEFPRKIKILGHDYQIQTDGENKTGNSNLGTHWGTKSKIWINTNQCREMQESTLIHEILEALNFHLSLKLSHGTICRLETALYQVFKENQPLWITKKEEKP